MKLVNIKILSFVAFLCIGLTVTAQKGDRQYNPWSIEVQTGYHIPVAPSDEVKLGDYDGAFKQFKGGIRYMFSDTYGIKAHYGFLKFETPDGNGGADYSLVGIDGYANLWKVANIKGDFRKNFGLLFHMGFGVTFSKPSGGFGGTDHIGNLSAGLTPQFKISKNFAVFADVAYIAQLKQHYAYNGDLLDPNYEHKTGGLFNASIGLTFSFGNRENHADWYYED